MFVCDVARSKGKDAVFTASDMDVRKKHVPGLLGDDFYLRLVFL